MVADWLGNAPAEAKRQPLRQSNTSDAALALWKSSQPVKNTTAETYLLHRAITLSLPSSLRFHPALKHPDTGLKFPTLVAAVQGRQGKVCGIQRTFLRLDGADKAAVTAPRMCLGTVKGGAVRLAPTTDTVTLTEGVEDALAFQQMTGHPAWAVLGTSGFASFEPPPGIRRIALAPDGDNAGETAISEAAIRLHSMGFGVEIIRPPRGTDWADLCGDYEERIAIAQHDNGQSEAVATRQTFAEYFGEER